MLFLMEVVIVTAKSFRKPETFFYVKGKDAIVTVYALKEIESVIFILLFNLPESFFIKFG